MRRRKKQLPPLHLLADACIHHCDVVRAKAVLETTGIDINSRFEDGSTVLMHAVAPDEHGDLTSTEAMYRMAVFLLELGADTEIKDDLGRTALDYANQLVDPNWKDYFGYGYPVGWFEEGGQHAQKIVELLRTKPIKASSPKIR